MGLIEKGMDSFDIIFIIMAVLVEGDEGDLTFQGSRFSHFERRWGA